MNMYARQYRDLIYLELTLHIIYINLAIKIQTVALIRNEQLYHLIICKHDFMQIKFFVLSQITKKNYFY